MAVPIFESKSSWFEVPLTSSTLSFRRQCHEDSFLLLISLNAKNPYSQSHEGANGKIILTPFEVIIG